MIFESHAHYDDKAFDNDRDALLKRLLAGNISRIINVGASIAGTKASIALAEAHAPVFAAVGVHPSEVAELNEDAMAWLKQQAAHPKAVAIGEIGLDYYWEKDPAARQMQKYWFARQMQLARECGLPVIIHSRDAAEDTLQVMKECRAEEISGVIHCYSYSPELADQFLQTGYLIGVGGVVTFKNAKKLKETVKKVPMERILLETDAPYMAPEPHRGSRNDSGNLVFVAEAVAALKGISADEVKEASMRNAYRLFQKAAG